MNGPDSFSSGPSQTQGGARGQGQRGAGKMRRLAVAGLAVGAVLLVFLVLGYLGTPGVKGVKGVFTAFFGGPSLQEGGRVPLYYQSPMHPWVKSHKPGKCTVCGMDLVPVYALPNPDSGEGHGEPPVGVSGVGGGRLEAASGETGGASLLRVGGQRVAGIRVEPVARREVLRTIRVPGVVEDDDSRHRILSATVPGRIEKLHINWEGAEVVEGQPLATFYSPDLGGVVGEYRALARGGAASPALLAAAENRLRQRGLSKAQIERMQTEGGTGLEFEILAPRTGTVTRRHVYEGQYVAEGTRLFELADFSRMWLQFALPEQDLPFVRVGLPVEIRLPSLPGRVFRSEIGFINPNLDPQTRTAKVRVELDNPVGIDGKHLGHEILHLSVAMGRIEVGGEALAVPRGAVLWSGTGARVYVEREPGTYERRVVELGRAGDHFWEVQKGLREGERVVVESNLLLDSQAQLDFSGEPDSGAPPAQVVEKNGEEKDMERAADPAGGGPLKGNPGKRGEP
jgi:Cu(I)/Ag(I) efflux system membrane fusion protein